MMKIIHGEVHAKKEPDVIVSNEGTVYHINPLTQAAKDWIAKNVQAEDWQWLGNSLAVEWRYAPDIVDGMIDAGLVVRM